MKQCGVILVDDDTEDMDFLKEAMEESGMFNIIASCNAGSGLVYALQHSDKQLPDAIICDLNMPFRSGIEVHNGLRLLNNFADIPFILISGLAPSLSLELKAEQEGLATVMVKPSSLSGYRNFCIQLYSLLLKKVRLTAFLSAATGVPPPQ
jgi:two-component system chemotaxis response regulator CheY